MGVNRDQSGWLSCWCASATWRQEHTWRDKRLLGLNRAQNILVMVAAGQHLRSWANTPGRPCGVVEMKTRFVVALALVAALVAGHGAFAFQGQKGSPPAPAHAAAGPAQGGR